MSDIEQLFGIDSEDEGKNSSKQKSASNSSSGSSSGNSSSGSDDEAASNRSGSASAAGDSDSGPASPTGSHRSGPASPVGSHHSGSASPTGSHQSGSASPTGGHRSNSASPTGSHRSATSSEVAKHSAPASPDSSVSSSSSHTPVASPAKSASGPASPVPSHSGSEASSRSRSPSPAGSAASFASGKSPLVGAQHLPGSPASATSQQSKPHSPKGSPGSFSANREDDSGSDSDIPTRTKARIASDSGSASESERKPRQRLASDSGSDPDAVRATAEDIFGEAGDISDDEKVPEEPEEKEVIPETRIEVEIPRVVADLGNKLSFAKLPNFLSVETRPFDPATYEDEIDEDEVMDEEGRARLKLKVENTIRWRYGKDPTTGQPVTDEFGEKLRESNCKVIKWSDGSMSLHLGTEIFDVFSMPMQDHNHLYIRQGTGLQGQAMFKNKLSFRPHSTESFTHRKMTMSLADRSAKTGKIKVLPIAGVDPELSKTDNIKKEEERLRASVRRENQQRRTRERGHGRGRLDASFLDDGISLNAIKSSYKKRRNPQSRDDLSDSADEDYETDGEEDMRRNRLQKAKRLDDSDDNSSDQQDSDGDTVKKKSKVMSGSESD